MRVIGGMHRSRILQEVPSDNTRETKDRVKESIFNRIHFDLPDAVVLDLFSGSGSLGIEALSRGASHCDFVDRDKLAITVTKANITSLRLDKDATISHQDALSFLETCKRVYDIILLDPPYSLDMISTALDIIAANKLLDHNGTIICLSAKHHQLTYTNDQLMETNVKTSGITKITYLKWGESI